MPDITILNGKKHMRRHMKRRARRNPDESLTSQAGSAALATVIAAPIAVALDRSIAGMKKKDGALRYTPNQSAMLLAGIGAVGGIALHVNGYAPRAGVALLSACAAVALKRSYDARSGQRPAVTPPGQPRVIPPPAATTTPALPATTTAPTTPALPATTTTPATSTTPATTTPATVSAQQTQAPATPATPGPTETPAVTPSGAIIRRAGAVYAAQYGQVSRTGAALEAERFQGYALEKPRVISAMASSEEIQGEQMVPRGILRPAFIKGGRASDMVQTLPRMEGVVRPRRVTQTVDPMAGTTVRRSGEIDMLGDRPMAPPVPPTYNPPPTSDVIVNPLLADASPDELNALSKQTVDQGTRLVFLRGLDPNVGASVFDELGGNITLYNAGSLPAQWFDKGAGPVWAFGLPNYLTKIRVSVPNQYDAIIPIPQRESIPGENFLNQALSIRISGSASAGARLNDLASLIASQQAPSVSYDQGWQRIASQIAAPQAPPVSYDQGWQRMQVRGDCSIEVRNAGPQGTPPMSVSTGQLPFGFSNVPLPIISESTAREYDERMAAQIAAQQQAAQQQAAQQQAKQDAEIARKVEYDERMAAQIAAQQQAAQQQAARQQAEQDAQIARKVLDKVGASSGAGPVTQAERDARLAQLGERTSIMGGLASFDKIRQQQRRQQQQQDCVCPSPSGARVMRRPQQ